MSKIVTKSALVFASVSLLFAASNGAQAAEPDSENPMDKLQWLLGNWTFEDNQVNGAYWERGARDCVSVLHNQYIRCESIGVSNSGNERSYYFIIGYNSTDERYEMIGLTSSYPRQSLYAIEVSEDGKTLELQNHFWTAEGIEPLSPATIQYNGVDKYVWEIRNGEADPETGRRAVGFVDTVTRVE